MQEASFVEAIEAIKAGEVARGQRLLWQYLQANPQDVKAWLWMAQTLPDDERRLRAMEECLKHNPESQMAQRAVEQLQVRLHPVQETITPIQEPEESVIEVQPQVETAREDPTGMGEGTGIEKESAVDLRAESIPADTLRPTSETHAVQSVFTTVILEEHTVEMTPPEEQFPAWFGTDEEIDSEETEAPKIARPAKMPKLRYRPSMWVWLAIALLVVLIGMAVFVVVKFILPYYMWRSGTASVIEMVRFMPV